MNTGPPSGELATLLHLGTPAEPVVVVSWAPTSASARVLARQTAVRLRAATAAHVTAMRARCRLRVVQPTRGSLRTGLRDRLRTGAGSGYVAYLDGSGAGEPSVLDHVLGRAGAVPVGRLSVGADGAVRIPVRRHGTRGLLRVGMTGTPADPSAATAGLQVLAAAAVTPVPAVLAAGECAGVTWLVEEHLPGRRPKSLSPTLVAQAAAFVAGLPVTHAPADLRDDAAVLAAAAPACTGAVHEAAAAVVESPVGARGQFRHGDLWAGNLLVSSETLTGVVDWDAWTPVGVPAVDLLHLIGTDRRIRTRAALGDVWLQRPWDAATFVDAALRHWPQWADDPNARAAVGRAWWLGQIAADLRRNPALAQHPDWLARNVTAVANALGASR